MDLPPHSIPWRGRIDQPEGDLALRWHQVVRPCPNEPAKGVAFLGFACDEGVSRNQGRTGAVDGPKVLRRSLANLPVRRARNLFDAGDVQAPDGLLEAAQGRFASRIRSLLNLGLLPIGLGGGHEIAYGSFLGLADHLADQKQAGRIGILNLDAHFDLRPAPPATSGTPFWQIAETCRARSLPFDYACLGVSPFTNTQALYQRASAWGVRYLEDEQMGASDLPTVLDFVKAFMAGVDHLYLTICLDVLPAFVAPGVSAPSARGVSVEVIEKVLDAACATGKVRVADVAELNPTLDADGRTAAVAARLIGRMVEGCYARSSI